MAYKGFENKWRSWISDGLASSHFSILFKIRPKISSLPHEILVTLVMLLVKILSRREKQNLFKGFQRAKEQTSISHLQYAD